MAKKSKKSSGGRRTDVSKSLGAMGDLGGENYFKPQSGKNTVRILPPWNDDGVFFHKATLHYNVREEGGPVPCRKMEGKECPVCQALKNVGKKLADKAKAKDRYYVNVIDRKNPEAGVKIWGMTPRNMKKIKSAMEDPDYGDLTDPEEGRDIIIEVDDSKGGAPQYEIRPRVKTSEIGVDDWEEGLHQLDEVVVTDIPSSKEYKKIVEEAFDVESDDDEDDEEEEKKTSSKKKDKKKGKKTSSKKKQEEEDDDDDEEEDDEEDSDSDDDDEDDEEEEEKPKKKKGKKSRK